MQIMIKLNFSFIDLYKTERHRNLDDPGDEMKVVPVLGKFSECCNPRNKTIIFCHKFFTYQQHEGQNFYDFITDLKKN